MIDDLTGKLLLAMPGMGDPRFAFTVIYICAHSDEGAMGLVVNKPAPDVAFDDMLAQLDIRRVETAAPLVVHAGGPVEQGRGFVLHSPDYDDDETTLVVDNAFAMTATLDVLEDLAAGFGPKTSLLALGYAGWGPGQLEDEIMANGWLTCAASHDLVFHMEDPDKWTGALKTLGVDPLMLSAEAGRA